MWIGMRSGRRPLLCLLSFTDLVLLLLQKWSDWYTSIYPIVLETVHGYNSFTTPGLDGNQAATKEVQTAVGHNTMFFPLI